MNLNHVSLELSQKISNIIQNPEYLFEHGSIINPSIVKNRILEGSCIICGKKYNEQTSSTYDRSNSPFELEFKAIQIKETVVYICKNCGKMMKKRRA